jgi:hypothetical protein
VVRPLKIEVTVFVETLRQIAPNTVINDPVITADWIDPNTRDQLAKVFLSKLRSIVLSDFFAAASNFTSALKVNQRTGSNYFHKGHFLIP